MLFWRKNDPFGFEMVASFSQKALSKSKGLKGHFTEKMNGINDIKTPELAYL